MNRRIILLILSFSFFTILLWSQEDGVNNIRIDHINALDYPNLKVYISVEDDKGKPNLSLVKGNFSAKIDTENPAESIDVEPFKYLEEPIHYVFFFSASGLMDGTPLAAQKKALLDFTGNMRERDTMSAYIVGETPEKLFTYKSSLEIPEDIIQEITVRETQAKIFDTIVSGVRQIEKDKAEDLLPAKERVIFILISDGRDNESRYNMEQTQQIMNDSCIPLYTVGLKVLSEISLSMLNEIANGTGGYYYYTPYPANMSENLDLFANQVLMSYVISFRVKGIPADDSYHQLMIQVDEKELSSQAFRNFMARKNPFPVWLEIVLILLSILLFIGLIFLIILSRIKLRKSLGISKRKCPECKRRMKDDWEFCPFCRYLPPKRGKKKKKQESA